MAGSINLNRRFGREVKELVGEDQLYHLRKHKGYEDAMTYFDKSIKTAFRGESNEDYYVNFSMASLQDDPANRLVSNCWNMKGDDVKKIFRPLIADIQRMVEEQVNLVKVKRLSENHPQASEIKGIFLVGGFGSSAYLRQFLQRCHPDIQVIQPHDAWSAIVKGAVLSQLPQVATITSTVSTKHYGVSAWSPFIKNKDVGQLRAWNAYLGYWRVSKMTWYINRGEDMKRDQRISFPFVRELPEDFAPESLVFRDNLIESSLEDAARYPKQGITQTNCTLDVDLRDMDRSLLKKSMGVNGKSYYTLYYNIVVTMERAIMKFSVEVDGKEVGSMQARYE